MPQYANSVWNEYTLDDVKIVADLIDYQGRKLTDTRLECANGPSIANNVTLHSKLWPKERLVMAPSVMLDKSDELKLQKYFRNSNYPVRRQIELTSSYTWILKTLPDKKVYLRTVGPSKFNEDRRVFASEVLDLIPILADRQKRNRKKLTTILRTRKNAWTLVKGIKSISLAELKEILEECDINKQQITLVPDLTFVNEVTYRIHVAQGHSAVTVYGPDGNTYLDVTQAIHMFFQGTVAELYWGNRFECDEFPGSMADFREVIIRVIEHYSLMEQGTYLTTSFVEKTLADARTHVYYKQRVTQPWTPILELLYCDYNDKIEMSYLFAKFYNFILNGKTVDELLLPVWRARVICLVRWAQIFFAEKRENIEKIVMRGIAFKVPATRVDREPSFTALLLTNNRDVFEQEHFVAEKCAGDIRSYFCAHPRLLTCGYQNWDEMSHIVRADKWVIREHYEIGGNATAQQAIKTALTRSQQKLVAGREQEERETLKAIELLKEFLDVGEPVLAGSEEEQTAMRVKQERRRNPRRETDASEPQNSENPDKSLQFPLEYYKRKLGMCLRELEKQKTMNRETTKLLIDRATAAEQRVEELEKKLEGNEEQEEEQPGELIEKLQSTMQKLKTQLAEKDETIRTLLDLLKTSP